MLILIAILSQIFARLVQGDAVTEVTGDDTIALLKWQIKELQRDYKELKDENRMLKGKLDNAINSIESIRKESSILSSHCRLLPADICGNCTCIDDYRSDNAYFNKYYCDCQRLTSKRDCLEHYQDGNRVSGVYRIHANHLKVMQVYCDQQTDNGGWTVFQRRIDASTNFYKDWNTYKAGFGQPHWNFWLGLENIYLVGLQSVYPKGSELRIDMQAWDIHEKHLYAKYNTFWLDNEKTNYTMHISGFSGNCGDSLTYHNKKPFATYDRSAGEWNRCAQFCRGAWWYGVCYKSSLNGEHLWKDEAPPGDDRDIFWETWRKWNAKGASLKYTDMKIRRLI